jgi:hypothetical protein
VGANWRRNTPYAFSAFSCMVWSKMSSERAIASALALAYCAALRCCCEEASA